MRYFLRLSVGLLAGAALLVAGCGQAASPPHKGRAASPAVALHLSAGPVVAAANGEFKVVLTALGAAKVGETYTLSASGAPFHRLGVPFLGTRERAGWTVEYTEEGTSGQTSFVLSGPLPALAGPGPSAPPPRSNTVVVKW